MNLNRQKLAAFLLVIFMASLSPIFAQEATETAEPEATDGASQILKKIGDIVKEDEPVAEKRAYVGEIVDIFNQTVVVKTLSGKKTAAVDEETEIIDSNRAEIALEDLEIGGWVILMGYEESTEQLNTKRIVITQKETKTEKNAFVGEIIEVEDEKLIIKTIGEGEPAIIVFDESTKISPLETELQAG
ncbi:hypothetical protein MUP65_00345, partial [Patescibacteria group bacterium]|nr:hypothetical protein [Patescibacteria group bacterium]